MIQQARIPGFNVAQHGFPFANCFPRGTPVLEIPTPFGTWGIGDAGVGVCGGMVYAAIDHFLFQQPIPQQPTKPVFQYLCKRLLESFNFPFGFMKYWDWQRRPHVKKTWLEGVGPKTLMEWPQIKTVLDSGQLCPLGIIKIQSENPMRMGENHQILAYGYEDDGENIGIDVYDPNYPGEPHQLLTSRRELQEGRPVRFTVDYEHIRGFFATEYTRPAVLPVLNQSDLGKR